MNSNTDYILLNKAIIIATQAHANQIDKGGNSYILHPLRVMLSLSIPEERICGVLHDVIEDAGITLEDLKAEGFDDSILNVLDLLTRRENQTYDEFIDRLLCNPIACRVKLADLADNMDISRIAKPTQKDYERISKYRQAVRKIEYYMNSERVNE